MGLARGRDLVTGLRPQQVAQDGEGDLRGLNVLRSTTRSSEHHYSPWPSWASGALHLGDPQGSELTCLFLISIFLRRHLLDFVFLHFAK